MFTYERRANYYETDMMGIVHHSNHIRYFEESRLAFMKSFDCDAIQMERDGIIIPNVDAYARYLIPLRFGEEMKIEVRLGRFTGSRMEYFFTIYLESIIRTLNFIFNIYQLLMNNFNKR